MVTTASKIFGFVFLLIGILGFFPALAPSGELLGIFHINLVHNIIHLASGLVALIAGYSGFKASRAYFQIFGSVYGLVALLGFFYGESNIAGLVASNMADTFLHVAIAAAALYLGFGAARDEAVIA